MIRENETAKQQAEQDLVQAQTANDFRQMQQLYETVSALGTEESELYEQLEQAEAALTQIETEDEV